jgi:hypothetical protein
MKIYLNGPDAVTALHKNGYTQDFQTHGDRLFWVKEMIFINMGEFAILECHKITTSKRKETVLIVYGILAPYHNIKGILVKHCKCLTETIPLPTVNLAAATFQVLPL